MCILHSDGFPCSYTSSHVQNQVRESTTYTKVIGPVHATWHDFMMSHNDKWTVFRYTHQEIRLHNLHTTARSKESRIVANEYMGQHIEGDKKKDGEKTCAEARLLEVMLETLKERDYEQQELLEILVKEPAFLTISTPSVAKLVTFALRRPDTFWVVRDPLHSLRIGLKSAVPPTLPNELGMMELSLESTRTANSATGNFFF